jgi:hypothetical protein
VVAATFEAVATYDAPPYDGRLLNVIAASRPLKPGTIDTRGEWQRLARGGARRVELPAEDSGRLVVTPHDERLVDILHEHVGEVR